MYKGFQPDISNRIQSRVDDIKIYLLAIMAPPGHHQEPYLEVPLTMGCASVRRTVALIRKWKLFKLQASSFETACRRDHDEHKMLDDGGGISSVCTTSKFEI